jgi:hypothetical protein
LQWENLRLAEGESLGERAKGVKVGLLSLAPSRLGERGERQSKATQEAARCIFRSPKKVLGPRVTHKERSERLKRNNMG